MAEMAVGKTIRMPCMRKGLVAYPEETILVTQNALESMAQSAHGIPVTIEHPGIPIDSKSLQDIQVVGRVSKFDYDRDEDLWYAEFVVDDDEAVKLLQSGYGVSTAWYGQDYAAGGTLNNVPYARELTGARYEHLAIVKNPRYEMAVEPVFLNAVKEAPCQEEPKLSKIIINSFGNSIGGKTMFAKIWRTVREEVKANENEELVLELEHGQVPLAKVVEELKSYKAEAASKEEKEMKPAARVLNDDDEVEVDGKKMRVQELVSEYKKAKEQSVAMKEPKKAEAMEEKHESAAEKMPEEEKKEAGMQEQEARCASEDEEKDEEKEKLAANARFNSLKDAYENGQGVEVETQFISLRERTEQGRTRYGTKK